MNTSIQKIKQEAYENIKQDKLGMLDVSIRNSIFTFLNDEKKSALLLLHTLKDYQYIWDKTWPKDKNWDDLFYALLKYIEHNINEEEFGTFLRKQHTYMESRLQEGKYDAVYIGLALVYAGYEIINGDFTMTDVIDEFSLEPEEWSSMFVASLSYNGAATDFNQLIPEKNREFWIHFIDNIQYAYDLKGFAPTDSVGTEKLQEEIIRTQTDEIDDNEKVSSLIGSLDEIYRQLIKENEWYAFKVESYYVNEKHSMIGFYKVTAAAAWEKYDNTKLFMLNNKHKVKDLIKELRVIMYHTMPLEGAWYKIELNFYLSEKTTTHFFYDTYFPFFEKWTDQLDFYKDFQNYKRDEQYLPLWLKDILVYHKPVSKG